MKKVSGLYVDNQGFCHVVFYNRIGRFYTKTIHNPEGKYCSSAMYSKEEVINQIDGMTRSFSYLGKVFTPVGNTGLDFFQMSKHLGDVVIEPKEGYTHESFYYTAKKNGCKRVDLYLVGGKTVIPAGALFEYHQES